MAKRGRKRSRPSDSGCRDRIAQLIEVLFQGNQAKAARALGVSQPHISKVLSGARAPTESFLKTLARHEGVNPNWLFHGEGQPLLPSTVGTLPVSTVILPGTPVQHRGLLTGERHPIAATLERGTRYILRLQPESPLVRTQGQLFLAGDALLVETARDHLDRPDVVNNQLCGVRIQRAGEEGFVMARVAAKPGGLMAELYDEYAPTGAEEPEAAREAQPKHVSTTPRRLSTPRALQAARAKRPPEWLRLNALQEVVGIVLLLERRPPLLI